MRRWSLEFRSSRRHYIKGVGPDVYSRIVQLRARLVFQILRKLPNASDIEVTLKIGEEAFSTPNMGSQIAPEWAV